MSVESKSSNLSEKPNGDKKGTGLTDRLGPASKELNGIGKILAQRRTMRDTTNHPSIELARAGRANAIQRRLKKSTTLNRASSKISDSGTPDDAGTGDGIGDSNVSTPQN